MPQTTKEQVKEETMEAISNMKEASYRYGEEDEKVFWEYDARNFVSSTYDTAYEKGVKDAMERIESKYGLTNNPEFFIEIKNLLKRNHYAKNLSNEVITQVAWESKDLTLNHLRLALSELLKK